MATWGAFNVMSSRVLSELPWGTEQGRFLARFYQTDTVFGDHETFDRAGYCRGDFYPFPSTNSRCGVLILSCCMNTPQLF